MDDGLEQRIAKLFTQQKEARAGGDFGLGGERLNQIEATLSEAGTNTNFLQWSRFYYEKAYMHHLQNHIEDAGKIFRLSGEYARKGADELRGLIGDSMAVLVLNLGECLPTEQAYKEYCEFYRGYCDLRVDMKDGTLHRQSTFNALHRLFHFSFELRLRDFEPWGELLKDHENIRDQRYDARSFNRLFVLQIDAREALYNGENNRAAEIFKSYLEMRDEVSGKSFYQIQRAYNEEICWDYLDYGKAFLGSTFGDKEERAVAVWKTGLKFSDAPGCKRHARLITEQLEKLGVPADTKVSVLA